MEEEKMKEEEEEKEKTKSRLYRIAIVDHFPTSFLLLALYPVQPSVSSFVPFLFLRVEYNPCTLMGPL